jgi:hypothetical protein
MTTYEQRQKIKSLAGQKTIMEIALETGVSPSTIRQFCKNRDLPIKKGQTGKNQKWKEELGMEHKTKDSNIVRPPATYDNRSAAEYYASL